MIFSYFLSLITLAFSLAKCPICDLEMEGSELEEHANSCAASRFGS